MITLKDFPIGTEPQDCVHPRRGRLSAQDTRVLMDSVTRDLRSIEDAWRRHDEAGLLECIHSLKGALFVVGEHETANNCGTTEQNIEMKGLDSCEPDIERLKAVLHRLLELYGND